MLMAGEVGEYLRRMARLHLQVNAGVQGAVATVDESDDTLPELVYIAAVNEYGMGPVPSRPFMRHSFELGRSAWAGRFRYAAKLYGRGEIIASERALRQTGAQIVGDIQESIIEGPWVSNAPSTIQRKERTAHTPGESRPLVDHGQLRQSIRAEVVTPAGKEMIA